MGCAAETLAILEKRSVAEEQRFLGSAPKETTADLRLVDQDIRKVVEDHCIAAEEGKDSHTHSFAAVALRMRAHQILRESPGEHA